MTALSSTSAGIAPPLSQEIGPYAVVTFRVRVGQTAQVTPQVKAVLEAAKQAVNAEALQRAAGLRDRVIRDVATFVTLY